MRKFFKKSVSFLVSIAIEKYLSNFSLSKGLKTNTHTDNYQNYIISYKKLNGAICWNIYWGMPECSEMPFLLRA